MTLSLPSAQAQTLDLVLVLDQAKSWSLLNIIIIDIVIEFWALLHKSATVNIDAFALAIGIGTKLRLDSLSVCGLCIRL